MGFPLGGLAQALGLGFQGFGQDQQRIAQQKRQQLLDQQSQQRLGMDTERLGMDRTRLGMDQATHAVQDADRTAQTAQRVQQGLANQRAHGAIAKIDPEAAGEFDPGTDYISAHKQLVQDLAGRKKEVAKQRAYYNTFKAEFPKHPLASQPFDEQNPADFAALLSDQRDLRKVNAAQQVKDHFTFPTATGEGGKQLVYRANTATGEITPTDVEAKAPAGGAGNQERAGMAAAFLSRLKMGKADFENAREFIKNKHAGWMLNNDITPMKMAESSAASIQPNPEAHGITGIANNALGSFVSGHANTKLGKDDPDYQRYVNLINSMSLAMTEVLPRPTQQILGIEKGINTVKAGDPPERIADIQHRLDKAYEYLFSDPEGMLRKGPAAPVGGVRAGGGGPTGDINLGSKQVINADQADFLRKKKGMTDEQIAAQYVVRP